MYNKNNQQQGSGSNTISTLATSSVTGTTRVVASSSNTALHMARAAKPEPARNVEIVAGGDEEGAGNVVYFL
jgi:hypothetical protein